MKPWADEIRRHIDAWSARLGSVGWWPRYVYHFTDVHNAASIVQSGCLLILQFNPNTRTPGPFQVVFSYREFGEGSVRTWKGEQAVLNGRLRIQVPDAVWGTVELRLDGALAFAGQITFEEIPF